MKLKAAYKLILERCMLSKKASRSASFHVS